MAALSAYLRVAAYHGSPHHAVLCQLAETVDDLPDWAWARWAVYTCGRQGSGDMDAERHVRAMERTLLSVHADVCHCVTPEGKPAELFVAEVIGTDWVYRQLRTYEYGGLAAFLHGSAGLRLQTRGEQARHWPDEPMRAYRVDERAEPGLVVTDVGSGEELAVLDLGTNLLTHPGGHLIGRLVPIAEEPGLVFESPPLPVDDETAYEVAALAGQRRPADAWVDVLGRARAAGRLEAGFSRVQRESVLTDIEPVVLLVAANQEHEFADVAERSQAGEDEVGRAAFRLLNCAWLLESRGGADALHSLALLCAAVLEPGAYERARVELTQQHRCDGWVLLASAAPEPAASRFAELASLSRPENRAA